MSELISNQTKLAESDLVLPAWVELVRKEAASLRYGSVLITVQGSQVVQVERSEKLRFESPLPLAPGRPIPRSVERR